MSQQQFEIGDVVAFKGPWMMEEAIGIIVHTFEPAPDNLYLWWISAPRVDSLWWNHPEGDFIGDIQFMTKITHLEPDDAPIQK